MSCMTTCTREEVLRGDASLSSFDAHGAIAMEAPYGKPSQPEQTQSWVNLRSGHLSL